MARVAGSSLHYVPVREDWVWNVIVPTLVYAALAVMGVLIFDHVTVAALYGVAVLALALLLIGIRNAWDLVVWISVNPPQEKKEEK